MTAYVSDLLTAVAAPVSAAPPATRVWEWRRDGSVIAGPTGPTYTLQAADVGANIFARQIETNFLGSTSALATLAGPVLPFSPEALFRFGEQGAWYDPSDLSTLFQDDAGTTPVTAAGQTVGLMLDKSGRGNHATQANLAQRPLYQTSPDRLVVDKIDDRLIVTVPTGGFNGTMVLATPEGTAAYGVNIPAGNFNIGGTGGTGAQYFPGTAIVGQIIRNGAMSQAQIDQAIAWLRDKGGGLNYGSVTNFTNFWRDQNRLTSFPLINTANGTNFLGTWLGCTSLTSFPSLDVSSGTTFQGAWLGCSSLTSFPLINTANGTNFTSAWQGCTSLTSFPLINMANGTNFENAWRSCTSLTSFPLINTANGTTFQNAWRGCFSLTNFPLINTANGTNFSEAWFGCSSLTSFPLINTANGTNFLGTWQGCSSLTSFPFINMANGTNFQQAWQNCSSLTTFPANFFDGCAATNFTNAFLNTALNQTSIDNILVSINTANTSNGTFNQSGGSAPSATGEAAIDALRARGWTVTVTGGY